MPSTPRQRVGHSVATTRRLAGLTQRELSDASGVSYGMVRAVERGSRQPSGAVLEALADALGVDPSRLLGHRGRTESRVHEELPRLSRAIATYDLPEDGPVRPTHELRAAVSDAVTWRLAAQYLRMARDLPHLLTQLTRALHSSAPEERRCIASLLVAAYRAADAVAYKFGAYDLSARLIELMRWAAPWADDVTVDAAVAYVRTETFFAARTHASGLQALETALDTIPAGRETDVRAARGTLHMRAAVIAGRARDAEAATQHLEHARHLADRVPEDIYQGTAFGPSSVRVHEVSVAVSLGDGHLQRALDVAARWAPPLSLPAERRSSYYIELGRVQLWAGQRNDAFESFKAARRIAPQHTREHPWVRDDIATLRRLKRTDQTELSHFADWCHAV